MTTAAQRIQRAQDRGYRLDFEYMEQLEVAEMHAKAEIVTPKAVEVKTKANKGMNQEQIIIRAEQEKLLAINRATLNAIMSGRFPERVNQQMRRDMDRNSERLSFLFKMFMAARHPYRTTRSKYAAA